MMKGLFLVASIIFSASLHAQTVIQMVEDKGVYKVPCEVNGLKVKMIFDTGAATVTISQSLAEMMVDNGYITTSDIEGQAQTTLADGRQAEFTSVVLKYIKIGDIKLQNIRAVVVDNQTAPLLFGQSAIQRLGEISIKGDKLYIKNGPVVSSSSLSDSDYFEKWDSNNFSYSNFTYGFGWILPKDFEWTRVDGQEQHTVFRAEGLPFSIFVNAKSPDNVVDLWKIYDAYTNYVEQMDIAVEKKTGLMHYERTFEKCSLYGQHSIKTTCKEYFKDSRFDEPKENYVEEYFVIWNGYLLIIAVKLPKRVYDQYDCSESISDIFKGFRLSLRH